MIAGQIDESEMEEAIESGFLGFEKLKQTAEQQRVEDYDNLIMKARHEIMAPHL